MAIEPPNFFEERPEVGETIQFVGKMDRIISKLDSLVEELNTIPAIRDGVPAGGVASVVPRPSVVDERGSALAVSLTTHLDQYVQVDDDVTLPSVTFADKGRRIDLLFYGAATISGSGASIEGDPVFAAGEAGSCIVTGSNSWFVVGGASS